jgi:TonB family protein
MKKYKVLFSPPELKDEEINQFKDFDLLINSQKAFVIKSNNIKLALLGAGAAIIIALYFTLSFPTLQTYSSELLVPEPESDHIIEETVQKIQIEDDVPEFNVVEPASTFQQTSGKSEPANSSAVTKSASNNAEQPASKKTKENNHVVFIEAVPLQGYDHLYTWIKGNMVYPQQAIEQELRGTVLVGFVINELGQPEQIHIIRGLSPEIDEEALRLVKNMPQWKPAQSGDMPVKTQVAVPIKFQLP